MKIPRLEDCEWKRCNDIKHHKSWSKATNLIYNGEFKLKHINLEKLKDGIYNFRLGRRIIIKWKCKCNKTHIINHPYSDKPIYLKDIKKCKEIKCL